MFCSWTCESNSYPLGDVGIHHEVVDMFLCSGQLQFPGNHCHYQNRASSPLQDCVCVRERQTVRIDKHRICHAVKITFLLHLYYFFCCQVYLILHHDSSEKTDAASTVGVRHHIPVANGQEGDGHHPQGFHVVTAQVPIVMVPEMSIHQKRSNREDL